jgi:hypothetical protein
MRVSDGSVSDNPVQGVNVTFLTTLERIPQGGGGGPEENIDRQQKGKPQDGDPIILGTSQSQVVTDLNGLASITPTVGSLGPCDTFIMVTAGIASAQYELENVDALPSNSNPTPPSTGTTRRLAPVATSFDAAAATALDEVPELVAIPQEMPPAEALPTACADESQEDNCEAGSNPGVTGSAGSAKTSDTDKDKSTDNNNDNDNNKEKNNRKSKDKRLIVSPSDASSSLPDVQPESPPVKSPAERATGIAQCRDRSSDPAHSTECERAGESVADILLEDKRTCRFAQTEQGTPP